MQQLGDIGADIMAITEENPKLANLPNPVTKNYNHGLNLIERSQILKKETLK